MTRCDWCLVETDERMRDVPVEPDKKIRDAKGNPTTKPGTRVKVCGSCAPKVSRQMTLATAAKAGVRS